MNFCSNCGNELSGGEKFCPNCGNKLNSYRPIGKSVKDQQEPADNKSTNKESNSRLLKGTELPKDITCQTCGIELELEKDERLSGEFICPNCGKRNQRIKTQHLDHTVETKNKSNHNQSYLDTNEEFLLSDSIQCPKCGVELELEISERRGGKFECPNCNNHSSIKELQENKSKSDQSITKSNYLLSDEVTCPFCQKDLLIDQSERLEGKFNCPNCKNQVIYTELNQGNKPSTYKEVESLRFEDKAWIFVASTISYGIVGTAMFVKYRVEGYKKKSNQVCITTLIGFVVGALLALVYGIANSIGNV